MRITRPKDWQYMTQEEKDAWVINTGNKIQEARDKFKEFVRKKIENESNQ